MKFQNFSAFVLAAISRSSTLLVSLLFTLDRPANGGGSMIRIAFKDHL
jgi:hypothetical protein